MPILNMIEDKDNQVKTSLNTMSFYASQGFNSMKSESELKELFDDYTAVINTEYEVARALLKKAKTKEELMINE